MLYGRPVVDLARPSGGGTTIEVVDSTNADADWMETFSRVRVQGFGLPVEVHDEVVADCACWAGQPGWRLYLARVDGAPAACATLAVEDSIGYLAIAATVPAHRGLGLQTALIERRILDAAAAGCELVSSQATFGSTSHRNLQRHLEVAFTKATWRIL